MNWIKYSKSALIFCLHIVVALPAFAQIPPYNADSYNIEIRFLQAYGTTGLDIGNPHEPTWQIAVENDVDGSSNSLLEHTPNYVNTNAYTYWLSTYGTAWHPVQDIWLETVTGNTTGKFDYEILSYENDCSAQSQYNCCIPICSSDDEGLQVKEGIVSYVERTKPGTYSTTEIPVQETNPISRVRFSTLWRHEKGTRNNPLDFGSIQPNLGYSHSNVALQEGAVPEVKYMNDWQSATHPNFNDRLDVTYEFTLTDERTIHLSSFYPEGGEGQLHLVALNFTGSYTSYLNRLEGEANLDTTLAAGHYALVVEGAFDSEEVGEFIVALRTDCSANDLHLDNIINSDEHYETDGVLRSHQSIVHGDIEYDARQAIELEPGFQVSQPATFSAYVDGCGVTDADGNVYKIIKLANLEWMAENLRTTHYHDAERTPIPFVADNAGGNAEWSNIISGAYATYNEVTYGHLYNWYAVDDQRGLCPTGWRVPSDNDWIFLENTLSGSEVAGGKLKEAGTLHWIAPGGSTNESGFTALPGGERKADDGELFGARYFGYFWTSSAASNDFARSRTLHMSGPFLGSDVRSKKQGHSVRCIRD